MKKRTLALALFFLMIFAAAPPAFAATVYTVHSRIPVYLDSYQAAQTADPAGTYEAGTYYLYKTFNGMVNVSREEGTPGGWINPSENIRTYGSYVTTASVNFRTGPGTAYAVIQKLEQGVEVELIAKTTSTWYKVRSQGKIGYLSAKYLKAIEVEVPSQDYVTIASVNFRTGPGSGYPLISYLSAGTRVQLLGYAGADWLKISYGGRTGYAFARYLAEAGSPEDPGDPTREVSIVPYVTRTTVNLRTGPASTYPLIRNLPAGTTLSYIGLAKEGWAQVRTAGRTGYLTLSYITPVLLQQPAARRAVFEGAKPYVLNAQGDVRSGPGTGFSRIARLNPGTAVGVVSLADSWAKIVYETTAGKQTGYLNTSFVSPQALSTSAKPRIGIAWSTYPLKYYVDAVNRAGGEAVLLPKVTTRAQARAALDSVSGIIFPGGAAVDSRYYYGAYYGDGQVPGSENNVSDYHLMREAMNRDLPTLGVCRGFQLMNALSGGSLTNLVTTDYERSLIHRDPSKNAFYYHDIDIVSGTRLASLVGAGRDNVNSYHRFIIKTLGQDLKISARSTDGGIEGIEATDKTFFLGIAAHPERMYSDGNTIYHSLFVELVEQSR